ncbi:MAG TPA: hypothetical protein VHR66_32165 [Gemmataceae bacterium]|jgi:hypothetical protein|nr:hypothetical protein [Gemmataceae bacterium]
MRRVLPLLVLITGCVGPITFLDGDDPSTLSNAQRRELESKHHLRDDRSWEEQERQVAELKSALGVPSEGDALGPNKPNPAK